MPETATELTVLAVEFTITVKADTAGTIFVRARSKLISSRAGVAFSITELTYTGAAGAGCATLFVTCRALKEAAIRPAEVCRGLVEGLV